MYAIKIAFPFLLFIVTSSTIHGMQVSLYCYDKPNCQGIRVQFENDNLIVPDLAQHPYYFDNRIQSCVFNGMFILYDGIYYNENNLGVSIIAIVIRRYQRQLNIFCHSSLFIVRLLIHSRNGKFRRIGNVRRVSGVRGVKASAQDGYTT